MTERNVLISGAGIAGLTLAILLREHGWDPLVVERDPAMRTEGYMMDFFGTGWEVAERMQLTEQLRQIRYPITFMEYVDNSGKPWVRMPVDAVRQALGGKYVYLRRTDLERILTDRAADKKVAVRYGTSIRHLEDHGDRVDVELDDGGRQSFALVIGADGVHSRVRELAFGPEEKFASFLGYYVAAFHVADRDLGVGNAVKLHEETDRLTMFYPLSDRITDATYIFRHSDLGKVSPEQRLKLVRDAFAGGGWISEDVLRGAGGVPIFFDSTVQIEMPQWARGRVALVGDACGCLTLIAGQGSQMAMGGAYVLANELGRHADHTAAFAAYQRLMQPAVSSRQKSAKRLARSFVPSDRSRWWLRHLILRTVLSRPVIGLVIKGFGGVNMLAGYH